MDASGNEEEDEDSESEEEGSLSDSSDSSSSSDEDSDDMEVEAPPTHTDKESTQSSELTDEPDYQSAEQRRITVSSSPSVPPVPQTEPHGQASVDGVVPVSANTGSELTLDQHSSPTDVSSPGSQTEPYDFERALESALQQQKCVEVDILKCVTLGPPAVGKTKLRRALTGNYDPVTESTPVQTGAEVIIEKFMDSEAKWQRFDIGDGKKALVTSIQKGDFVDMPSDNPRLETQSQPSRSSRVPVSKHIELVHSIAKTRALLKKLRESREAMLQQLLRTDKIDGQSLHKARIIHLIDSGGQTTFFDVHATLATSRAAYLQVFNLSEELDSKPKMTYRRHFPTKVVDSRFRSIDFMARMLATLQDCKKKFMVMDDLIQTVICGQKSNDLPIFLIGTHLDKATSEEGNDGLMKDTNSAIEKKCKASPMWTEVVPNGTLNFHPVSCLRNGREGITALRKKISECRAGYPIRLPLSWFFVELMFWAEKAAGDGCMKYSDLRDICIQDKLLQSEEEFFTMVKLFHLLGLFVFPDLGSGLERDRLDDCPVFTDPNFLFGEVSKILDIPFRDELSGSLKDLQETGMLQQGVLGDLDIPASAGTLENFHEWLSDYLIHSGLAALVQKKPKRKGKEKVPMFERGYLFIPSVLPPRPSAKDNDPDVCSLLVAFLDEDDGQNYHIPQGIFCHFIAGLMQDKKYMVAPGVYRDLVSFKNVCRKRVTYTVKVWEELDHLAIFLVPESETGRSSLASYDAIRKELLSVLRTAWKRIYQGTPPALVVGFECPCEERRESRDHIAQYREKHQELCCCNRLKDGKIMPPSPDQLKWFGIPKDKAVTSVRTETLPSSPTEPSQPMSTDRNTAQLQSQLQPTAIEQANTPVVGSQSSAKKKDKKRSSSLPSVGATQTLPSMFSSQPSGSASGNLSIERLSSDQPSIDKGDPSVGAEISHISSTAAQCVPVGISSSQPCTAQSQPPPPLKRAHTAVAGRQSSTKKKTKKLSTQKTLGYYWRPSEKPSLQRDDTEQLNRDTPTGGSQAAGHRLPLPTHSSSSSGSGSADSGGMASGPLSQPGDSPSDTEDMPPPPKRSKATHSSSSSGGVDRSSEEHLFPHGDCPSDTEGMPPPPKRSKSTYSSSSSGSVDSSSEDPLSPHDPMHPYNDSALASLTADLKSNVLMSTGLADMLETPAGGFMNRGEAQSVRYLQGDREQMGKVIEILRGKENKHFHTFCNMLRKSNYEVWAINLEKEAEKFRIRRNES